MRSSSLCVLALGVVSAITRPHRAIPVRGGIGGEELDDIKAYGGAHQDQLQGLLAVLNVVCGRGLGGSVEATGK